MLKQIKLLTKLELCNIYNLNVLRFSKNSRRKKKDTPQSRNSNKNTL